MAPVLVLWEPHIRSVSLREIGRADLSLILRVANWLGGDGGPTLAEGDRGPVEGYVFLSENDSYFLD